MGGAATSGVGAVVFGRPGSCHLLALADAPGSSERARDRYCERSGIGEAMKAAGMRVDQELESDMDVLWSERCLRPQSTTGRLATGNEAEIAPTRRLELHQTVLYTELARKRGGRLGERCIT